jgi:hypothetical protein
VMPEGDAERGRWPRCLLASGWLTGELRRNHFYEARIKTL